MLPSLPSSHRSRIVTIIVVDIVTVQAQQAQGVGGNDEATSRRLKDLMDENEMLRVENRNMFLLLEVRRGARRALRRR